MPRIDYQTVPNETAQCSPRSPLVSVCIVNWNCADYLRACLQSLLHQAQGVSFEIIVVDNASEDGAPEMVEEEFPEVRLIRNKENRGYAPANNQAAAIARGDYLFFINNDTVLEPCTLQKLVDYSIAHPEIGALGPGLRDGSGKLQCSSRRYPTIPALLHKTLIFKWTGIFRSAYKSYRGRERTGSAHPTEVVLGAALLTPRSVFLEVGGWCEEYPFGGEDVDLCSRIRKKYQIVHLPEVEMTHFGRVSSRQRIEYVYSDTLIGVTQFLRKNGSSPLALFLYKLAITVDAPLHWLALAIRCCWRRLRGHHHGAEQVQLALRGLNGFLRSGLRRFWKC